MRNEVKKGIGKERGGGDVLQTPDEFDGESLRFPAHGDWGHGRKRRIRVHAVLRTVQWRGTDPISSSACGVAARRPQRSPQSVSSWRELGPTARREKVGSDGGGRHWPRWPNLGQPPR